MLPRWFRILLVADIALLAAVAVLGTRLALDGAHAAGRVITWAHPGSGASPHAPGTGTPLLPATPAPAPTAPRRPPVDATLLRRLDSDASASANGQRGLLGVLEEAIRARVVTILDRIAHGGRGG